MIFSKYGVEEYIADGVLLFGLIGTSSKADRTVYIRKMRGTNHSGAIHPSAITENGFVVKKVEDVFR